MELELILKNRLAENEERLDYVQRELDACCEGRLSEEKQSDKVHFIQTIYSGGVRTRKGVTKKPEVIDSLIRRRIFGREKESLLSERNALIKYEASLISFDLNEEIEKLRKACPDLDEKVILHALHLNTDEEWQDEPYEQSDYMPEMKRHFTSRGLKVRSKSELIIAEKLYFHDLPFRYEQVLRFGSETVAPDFTIRRKDGKIFIWEHMGLMTNDSYRLHQKRKIELYEHMGFVPWNNLIITYDSLDGLIDLRIIESEIQNKLL